MIRRARGRHTAQHLGSAAIPAPDLVAVMRGYEPRGNAIDLPEGVNRNVTEWLARLDDRILPDGPVGVFLGGRVHIGPATFDPPADSPFARMCRQLDDMQPTIRQLTQKDSTTRHNAIADALDHEDQLVETRRALRDAELNYRDALVTAAPGSWTVLDARQALEDAQKHLHALTRKD